MAQRLKRREGLQEDVEMFDIPLSLNMYSLVAIFQELFLA
jgi:hypothetical protein